MSFRIDDLLKPDVDATRERKQKLRNETSQITHIHHHFDEIGGILSYRENSPEQDLEVSAIFKEVEEEGDDEEKGEVSTYRKRRILFTREQTYELQKVFQYQQYLTVPQRDYLSRKINLTPTQVKIWFQNHRYKLKKYVKECNTKTKSKYPAFGSPPPRRPSETSTPYNRPHFLSGRLSPPYSSCERRSFKESPTMFSLSKSYARRYSPDRSLFASADRPCYSFAFCDCDKYKPPSLKKWKRSNSEGCCNNKSKGD